MLLLLIRAPEGARLSNNSIIMYWYIFVYISIYSIYGRYGIYGMYEPMGPLDIDNISNKSKTQTKIKKNNYLFLSIFSVL